MEQSCPVGDDPLTKNQVNEIQLLRCLSLPNANYNFLLYFNGIPSKWIPATANKDVVTAAILSIPTIHGVTVTFSQSGPTATVCSPLSNIITIEFTHNFGPLPPLVPLLDQAMRTANGKIDVSGKCSLIVISSF